MKRWLKKLELIIDKSIPYLLIILLGILIIEFFFHDFAEHYIKIIHGLDYFIIGVFLVDLIFKYNHVRKIKPFIKKYWLDILAVFPFFLAFRVYELLFGIGRGASETASTIQAITHTSKEGIEIVEKEAPRVIKEAEAVTKARRSSRLVRWLRPIFRSPRLLKIVDVFEHPNHRTH